MTITTSLEQRVVRHLTSAHGWMSERAEQAWVRYSTEFPLTVSATARNETEDGDDYADTLADDIVSWGGGARGF